MGIEIISVKSVIHLMTTKEIDCLSMVV